jgi:hypothetical protein
MVAGYKRRLESYHLRPWLTRATIDHFLDELGAKSDDGNDREDASAMHGLAATA